MGNVRTGRDIDAALRKKGFRRDLDGKHIWYYFQDEHGEDSCVKVMVSHGVMGTTLGTPLIALMARQIHLTKTQFLDLIDCPLDEESYRQILRNAGFDV